MVDYQFKPKPELFWFMVVAMITVAMQVLVEFDPATITDWNTWGVGIGAAMVRAAAGAFLAYVTKEGIVYTSEDQQ
jgi:hypothetical protein